SHLLSRPSECPWRFLQLACFPSRRFLLLPPLPRSALFPYTTLFRSADLTPAPIVLEEHARRRLTPRPPLWRPWRARGCVRRRRSEPWLRRRPPAFPNPAERKATLALQGPGRPWLLCLRRSPDRGPSGAPTAAGWPRVTRW